jgi:cation/acetate symporter
MLVAILLAPYLRKFGQYTVPDFLGARFGGNIARSIGVIVLLTASFVYVVAQIVGVGIITQRFLDVSFALAVFLGLAGILVCSMMGGMRAVTWTQVAQYIILIIAYLIPAVPDVGEGHRRAAAAVHVRLRAGADRGAWSRLPRRGHDAAARVTGWHTAPFVGAERRLLLVGRRSTSSRSCSA